jgi:hypothetical protein
VEKFPKKNLLRFFRKWAQKKAGETLKRKLAYVNPIFPSFSGQIDTNVIFEHNFEKKIEKTQNFRKNFCCHLGCFMRSKHKQLIWCIFMT